MLPSGSPGTPVTVRASCSSGFSGGYVCWTMRSSPYSILFRSLSSLLQGPKIYELARDTPEFGFGTSPREARRRDVV